MTESTPNSNLGRHLFGVAALAFGVITLAWHDYNGWHQIPYLVDAAGAAQIIGGAAVQFRRTAKAGVPLLLSGPHNYTNWSETAETFAIAGVAWILADLLGENELDDHRPPAVT